MLPSNGTLEVVYRRVLALKWLKKKSLSLRYYSMFNHHLEIQETWWKRWYYYVDSFMLTLCKFVLSLTIAPPNAEPAHSWITLLGYKMRFITMEETTESEVHELRHIWKHQTWNFEKNLTSERHIGVVFVWTHLVNMVNTTPFEPVRSVRCHAVVPWICERQCVKNEKLLFFSFFLNQRMSVFFPKTPVVSSGWSSLSLKRKPHCAETLFLSK